MDLLVSLDTEKQFHESAKFADLIQPNLQDVIFYLWPVLTCPKFVSRTFRSGELVE